MAELVSGRGLRVWCSANRVASQYEIVNLSIVFYCYYLGQKAEAPASEPLVHASSRKGIKTPMTSTAAALQLSILHVLRFGNA